MHASRQVLSAPCICRCARRTRVLNISVHICVHARYRVCICARVCAVCLFSVGRGSENGGVQLVYEGTCCLVWGIIFDRRRDGCCLCLLYFQRDGSACGCMCVYMHTHTHTAHMGYPDSDVSPGVGMRHLEGPKHPDELNLGIYVFVYVYKVHINMYVVEGRMRSCQMEYMLFPNSFSSFPTTF